MAVPIYQAVSNASGHSATTGALTVPWPAGHAAGDIGIVFVETDTGTINLTTAAGFTQIGSQRSATGTSLAIFWCRATSGAMSSPVFGALSNHQYGVMLTFRGCKSTGTPWARQDGGTKNTASTSATIPSIDVAGEGDNLVVMAITKNLDATAAFASAQTNAALTNITERFDAGTQSGNGGGIAVWHGDKTTRGPTGTTAVTVTSSTSAYMIITLLPEPLEQSGFRTYEDGTEAGATAIAALDTNINRSVDADSNLSLRLRVQNTQPINQPATDDYQLEYSMNNQGFNPVNSGIVADSMEPDKSSSNTTTLGSGGITREAQSFTGNGKPISAVRFYVSAGAALTGNAVAKVYAHSGTFGTGGVPTGAALATSDNLDTATIPVGSMPFQYIRLPFSGAEQIILADTTHYFISLEYASGVIRLAYINEAHPGNSAAWNGSVWSSSIADIAFFVETTPIAVSGYDSASLTDGGATTNRLGAGGYVNDNFNDNTFDTSKWTRSNATQIVEASQQIQLSTTTTAAYYNLISLKSFSLIGSSAQVEIADIGNTAITSYEAYPLQINASASNKVEFAIAGGNLLARKIVSGTPTTLATVTFNATNHRWLRIRESGGTTFWDASADGSSWNNIHSVANPITLTTVYLEITVGTWQAEGSTTTLKLDNVAGGGVFLAGKVSEDGLVDNHQITASNYTEYLYSLTLNSAALTDNDTIDFRVLRNEEIITYAVTPRITVSKTAATNTSNFFLMFE